MATLTRMTKIDFKSLLLGLILGAGIVALVAGSTPPEKRPAWEYKVVVGSTYREELGNAINSSVAEGWEFVSASGPNSESSGFALLRRAKR